MSNWGLGIASKKRNLYQKQAMCKPLCDHVPQFFFFPCSFFHCDGKQTGALWRDGYVGWSFEVCVQKTQTNWLRTGINRKVSSNWSNTKAKKKFPAEWATTKRELFRSHIPLLLSVVVCLCNENTIGLTCITLPFDFGFMNIVEYCCLSIKSSVSSCD